ncbi:MAG: hypothetical protein NTX51_11410, partial [Verrucomicrobia bacterium]|nr:hypothetical protein [Verrucomicrobiota bacterium]
ARNVKPTPDHQIASPHLYLTVSRHQFGKQVTFQLDSILTPDHAPVPTAQPDHLPRCPTLHTAKSSTK